MWASILRRHFPSSSWKKYYSKITFFSLSVVHGLKPSFLWDIGPSVTPEQILSFVREWKSAFGTRDRLLILCIDTNIFVANANRCLKALRFEKRKFVRIGKGESFSLVEEQDEDPKRMIAILEEKLEKGGDCEIWDINGTEIVCPPCAFGLLLNYPLVYYFDGDHPPFPVRLKVYEVYCECEWNDVTGRFQVFAFSVPQSVLNTDTDSVVSSWFDSIRFSGENIFSNLSLESHFVEVNTLIL